ncbi:TRAP transporter small permease subunit [Gammaproteobacteria bacterium]|nr:TRAP transporter small permease subunit [Gammaproteobacteria bacterium]
MYARLQSIADLLDRLAEKTGRLLAWLTLAMVLITFAVVVLRKLFETGSIAMQESVSYLHAAVFMLAAAYTLKQDGHVRVDIFYQKFSPRTRAWVDLLGTLLLLFPVCLYMLFSSLEYVAASWSILEGSREADGLDGVFLLKTAIPVMAVLLLLQGCSIVLHKLLLLAGHTEPVTPVNALDQQDQS